ncbi:hypothetical protein G9A89_018825 [Geosiphon pyriformis]|nr:hypothetical protein G9A89_018825 [Geosiphon pyriformis]
MQICHNCGKQGYLRANCHAYSNQQSGNQYQNSDCHPISTNLPANNAKANISTTHISTSSLLTAATNNISTTTATNNLSNTHTVKIMTKKYRNQVYSKPEFSELFKSSGYLRKRLNQHSEIQMKAITYQYSASHSVIFPFEIEELTETPLFSGAALEEKSIMVMYMDGKIDDQFIKLILDSGSVDTVSTRIITTNGATKTPIGKIDNLSIKINGITIPIKSSSLVRTDDTHVYQPCVVISNPSSHHQLSSSNSKKKKRNLLGKCTKSLEPTKTTISYHQYFLGITREKGRKTKNLSGILTKTEKLITTKTNQQTRKERTTLPSSIYSSYAYTSSPPSNYCQPKLECIDCGKKLSSIGACCGDNKEYFMATRFYCRPCKSGITNHVSYVELSYLTKEYMPIHHTNKQLGYPHDKNELWRMAYVKAKGVTTSKILEIKNNSLSLLKPEYVQTFDIFGNIENNPKEFHEHYQYLAPTREEQEQHLEHNCTSESELTFNSNSNSDNNNNENNSFSSTLNSNKIYDDLNSDSNPETFIALPNFTKEQELK